jgi:hypothetical protein
MLIKGSLNRELGAAGENIAGSWNPQTCLIPLWRTNSMKGNLSRIVRKRGKRKIWVIKTPIALETKVYSIKSTIRGLFQRKNC